MTGEQLSRIAKMLERQQNYPGQLLPLAESDNVQVEGQPKGPCPSKKPGPSGGPGGSREDVDP